MQQPTGSQIQPPPAWRSPWFIGWVALVATFLAVNGVMVYLAITTNPGLVVEDYYDRGQHYEHSLASKLVQDPGWSMRMDVPDGIKAGEARVLRFSVSDRDGQAVAVEGVTFYAYRPSNAGSDFSLPMVEEAPGRFVAEVSFPMVGVWDMLCAARLGPDEHSVGRRIIVAKP